jgi:hypothetical protein
VERRSSPSPIAGALLALAAATALATAVLYLLAVRTTEGQRIDDAARGGLSQVTNPRAYNATSSLLDTISISSLALLGVAVMAVALLRGRRRLALGAGAIVLGANLTTQFLKEGLPRPELAGNSFENDPGSLPSGHVTVAMSLALALVLVTPPALRWLAAIAGGAYAVGVGVAVLALDWHRPSDVIAAYLVTTGWTALVGAFLLIAGGGELGEPDRPWGPRARLAGAAAALLALGFVAVVAVAAAHRLDLLSVVDDRTSFAAAAAACAVAGATLAALVTMLLQRAAGPERPSRAPAAARPRSTTPGSTR